MLSLKLSVLAAMLAMGRAAPFVSRQNIPTPEQIAALAPQLGALPNTNPNRFGDCDGPPQANGQIPRVPCQCPPTQDRYIAAMTANILAGHAVNNTVVKVTFPTGDSVQDKHGRITAAIISLQNLEGAGKGCPGVSTTLGIQSNNLDRCGDFFCDGNTPAVPSAVSSSSASSSSSSSASAAASSTAPPVQPAPTQAPVNVGNAVSTVTVTSFTVVTSIVTVTRGQEAASSTSSLEAAISSTTILSSTSTTSSSAAAATSSAAVGNGNITRELVDSLAPELGSHPNNNPNQFGDCDGPPQPDGSIKRVPCSCPPERDDFIDLLFANIQAGHVLQNPGVKVDFPTGNSKADQHARITASVVTLQSITGPGQGCPNVATTFAAQSNAIDAS